MSIYDFSFTKIDGSEGVIGEYLYNVILIVNIASRCVFADQLSELEALYEKYNDSGFTVIAFPTDEFNDDMHAESVERIKQFCIRKHSVTFPFADKCHVRGDEIHPLFRYLSENSPAIKSSNNLKAKLFHRAMKAKYEDTYTDNSIKWNYTKFLIDRSGAVADCFDATVRPLQIEHRIQHLLNDITYL